MNLVIDTNVFVSGMMSPERSPGKLLLMLYEERFTPVVARGMFDEYRDVLCRDKFNFPKSAVEKLLEALTLQGLWIEPPISTMLLPDPTDRLFLDTARFAACPVVTGNARHFPVEAGVEILSPAACVERLLKA